MLHSKTFRVLFLLGGCLSSWAAPLRSTSAPQMRICDRKEEESKKSSEHLASHQDDNLCTALPKELSPSHKPKGTVGILDSASFEDKDGETDAVKGIRRQKGLVKTRAKQHQVASDESNDESSSEVKDKNPVYAITFAISGESKSFTFTVTQVTPKKQTAQIGGLGSDRHAPTQEVLGHDHYMTPDNLPYSDVGEAHATVHPLEEKRRWEVETVNRNLSVSLSSKHWSGISTESPLIVSYSPHDSVNQFSSSISPTATSLVASGSLKGGSRESTGEKDSAAEDRIFTATENQDKALALGLLQPDLTLSSTLAGIVGTWTEPVHLQGVEDVSILPLSQEVSTEVTMSSEDLPLIFEPLDDVTPASSSALASELSVAIAPETGILGEAELEQTVSMDTGHAPSDASLIGPSDWPSPWQMSGAEISDAVTPSQMPISRPFSEADLMHSERTEKSQSIELVSTLVNIHPSSPSPVSDTQQVSNVQPTHSPTVKPKSGLEELESEEDEDEEDEDIDESDEEESKEDLTEAPVHNPSRPPYRLIPPPPVWGQRNQGLIRSWVELIQEKAGYVSGMLAPVGIGIAGALLIVGALYSIRMIHRKRRNNFKHQRRKQQPKEVRNGPDQAMLLADSSEDEL